MKIAVCRTDNIGDVILTFPLVNIIKKHLPNSTITFIGKQYTQAIIKTNNNIDEIISVEDIFSKEYEEQKMFLKNFKFDIIIFAFPEKRLIKLAKDINIPSRVATSRRIYSWLYCNKKINFSRRKSNLHEAQLNLKLLKGVGLIDNYELDTLKDYICMNVIESLPQQFQKLISPEKYKIILHPKSKGSAREWGLQRFQELIDMLDKNKFQIFITGTENEGASMRTFLDYNKEKIVDLTGKLTLSELIAFINSCNALVAASTGVLHIAAGLGIKTIGIYAPMRPIFPTRWAPIGKDAHVLVLDKNCNDCKKTKECECIKAITPGQVIALIE